MTMVSWILNAVRGSKPKQVQSTIFHVIVKRNIRLPEATSPAPHPTPKVKAVTRPVTSPSVLRFYLGALYFPKSENSGNVEENAVLNKRYLLYNDTKFTFSRPGKCNHQVWSRVN